MGDTSRDVKGVEQRGEGKSITGSSHRISATVHGLLRSHAAEMGRWRVPGKGDGESLFAEGPLLPASLIHALRMLAGLRSSNTPNLSLP